MRSAFQEAGAAGMRPRGARREHGGQALLTAVGSSPSGERTPCWAGRFQATTTKLTCQLAQQIGVGVLPRTRESADILAATS